MRRLSPAVFTPSGPSRAGRKEQLFHAAISAFCALTRPSRAEVAQIDDLTLSLLDHVPPASKRFAAAAFSEIAHAPPGLVRRLSEESVEIAAPLLVRSPVLSDIDLVGIIGRRGAAHARAIARRPDLNPAIADLVRAIAQGAVQAEAAALPPSPPPQDNAGPSPRPDAAEGARQRLRTMMAGSSATPDSGEHALFRKLRDTALDSHRPVFETALADIAGIGLEAARRIAADGFDALPRTLRTLGLRSEQAFLVTAALHPALLAGPDPVRRFLLRFEEPGRFTASTEPSRLRRA